MRRWKLVSGALSVAVVAGAFEYGCGQTTAGTCADNGTCAPDGGTDLDATNQGDVLVMSDAPSGGDDSGSGGRDANDGSSGGSSGGGDAGCDGDADVPSQPCLVNETDGIFVSPTGNDTTGQGTRAVPLKTIGAGIASAISKSFKNVFVCAGTYPEHLVVGAAQDGVGVYGGFDCTAWTHTNTPSVKVQPSTVGYALELDLLTKGATFEDMEFDAKDGVNAGDSSIAVFANQSANVSLARVIVSAGNGVTGSNGIAGSNYTAAAAPSGNDATGIQGGASVPCSCADGENGSGGAGGSVGPPAISGVSGAPALDGGQSGHSGDSCQGVGTGGTGANSPDAPALSLQTSFGTLSSAGWISAKGRGGTTATIAQGGGGGGANTGSDSTKGGGGSGGCGGCGGGGGSGGGGGGSSIAIISYQSTVFVATSTIESGNGGTGGTGGGGQAGQGPGDHGQGTGNGCTGGPGGNGGGGSGAGGGAGGLSLAIGYSGTAPNVPQSSNIFRIGNLGTGGAGGTNGGVSNGGPKGQDGVAQTTLDLAAKVPDSGTP